MSNWHSIEIHISLPVEFKNPAQRQTLWEIFRDLKYHIESCTDESEEKRMGIPDDEIGDGDPSRGLLDGYEKLYALRPFNILRPRPADIDDNWREWNLRNWGTKSDILGLTYLIPGQSRPYHQRAGIHSRKIKLCGDTFETPPTVLLEYLTSIGFEVFTKPYNVFEGGLGDAPILSQPSYACHGWASGPEIPYRSEPEKWPEYQRMIDSSVH